MEDLILKRFHPSLRKKCNVTFQATLMAGKYQGTIGHTEAEKLILSKHKTSISKTSQVGCTTSLPRHNKIRILENWE